MERSVKNRSVKTSDAESIDVTRSGERTAWHARSGNTQMKLERLALIVLVLAGPLYPEASSARSWPAKPARIIVPYATDGVSDMLGRLLA